MKKMKKIGVLLLALILSFVMSVPAFAAENFTVHAKTPSDWAEPGLWAWSAPDGTNVFDAWPGEKLTKDEANEGWYYYDIPDWVNSIIINEGVDKGDQTADVSVEAKELWITVADDFTATVAYEAPEGFVSAEAAVTDAVPADAAQATSESAPKTGELAFSVLWAALAVLSGISFITVKRKRIA